jgi:hypothetical protein
VGCSAIAVQSPTSMRHGKRASGDCQERLSQSPAPAPDWCRRSSFGATAIGRNAAAAGGVGLAREAGVLRVCVQPDLVRCRLTERRNDESADASDSRRRKRPELGQLQPAQPGQRQRAPQGQRRQDDSDGIVRTRCDESPAHSRPQQLRHRWRQVRTRLRPRRPTWFSRTSETSCAPFCWTNVSSSTPGNHTDMAVNPAQPPVHEPDNSTAPVCAGSVTL